MKTPLTDTIKEYVDTKRSRFHTPGHQGILPEPFSEIAKYDVTEIDGLDDLYNSSGAIRKTENEFANIYGRSSCLLSAGGSTLCIQTMIALAVPIGGKLLISREAHTSAVNTMALLDINPIWIYPNTNEETGILDPAIPSEIEKLISDNMDISAVYITIPTYYGRNWDIEGISEVCRKYKKPLLVDCAQGAHYKFLEESKFPLDLGADMCCVSLHKTLPSMTGAALLHLNKSYSFDEAKRKMALFGSTSPSYPIMMSADSIIPYLSTKAQKDVEKNKINIELLKIIAKKEGFIVPDGDSDPTRLTIGYGAVGYNKKETLEVLHKYKIEPEMIDDYYFVLLGGVNHTADDWAKVSAYLSGLKKKAARPLPDNSFPMPESVISIREAVFSPTKTVPRLSAEGKVAGSIVAPCPPGIPIVIPGEKLDQNVLGHLKKHRIMAVNVL